MSGALHTCPHCGGALSADPPAAGLTPKQAKLLAFIAGREACPSIREMAEHMGHRSVSSVHRIIGGLEERGYIRRLPGQARSIAVVRGGR